MTTPAPAPLFMWIWNSGTNRLELWSRNPADPPGVGRVVAVHAAVGSDLSDLPQNVQVTPLSGDVLAAFQADTTGESARRAAMALNNDGLQRGLNIVGITPQQQAGQQGALRDTAANIETRNDVNRGVLNSEIANATLDQQELLLRQKMAEAGYNAQQIADFFAQGGGRADNGTVMPPGGESPAFPGRMPDDYVRAYANTNQLTQDFARLGRAQQLQQVENAYLRHQGGAERLQTYADARKERDRLADQYALDQQRMAADPGNDKRLRPMVGGQWSYDNLAGSYDALQQADAGLAKLEQTYDPSGYAENQRRKREYEQGGWLPEDVRKQLYGALPRYAGGGEFAYLNASGSNPTAGYTAYAGGPYEATGGPPQGANSIQQDNEAYRAQSFANERQQAGVAEQIAQIQQDTQFRLGQMQQAHQQRMDGLRQQYTLMSTEFQRQMSQIQQRRSVAAYDTEVNPVQRQPQIGTWAG